MLTINFCGFCGKGTFHFFRNTELWRHFLNKRINWCFRSPNITIQHSLKMINVFRFVTHFTNEYFFKSHKVKELISITAIIQIKYTSRASCKQTRRDKVPTHSQLDFKLATLVLSTSLLRRSIRRAYQY